MEMETLKGIAGVIIIYAMVVFGVIIVNERVDVPESYTSTVTVEK